MIEPWARGFLAVRAVDVPHDLAAEINELADCAVLTEPALFVHDSDTYLSTNCAVATPDGGRDAARERVVLLREAGPSYEHVGTITDGSDAADLGVDRLEQGDLSVARDGTVLFIATPISDSDRNEHQGCVVFEFEDFEFGAARPRFERNRTAEGRSDRRRNRHWSRYWPWIVCLRRWE